MSRLRTLDEIDDAIAHEEERLSRHRAELAELEAEGLPTARAREVVRFVEARLVPLRLRRRSRILARMTEHQRAALLSGTRTDDHD